MSVVNGTTMDENFAGGGNKRMRKQTDRITSSNLLGPPAPKKARQTSSSSAASRAQPQQQYVPMVPVYETKVLPSVALSQFDKASQLDLSDDQLICCGCEGGYRMVRATHGVHRGSYLWEVEILPTSDPNAHYRVGWSTRQGELQAPVGFDQYSFGYRDGEGSRVHKSVRIDDYGEPFGPGDVIGCFIQLDDSNLNNNRISFYKNGVEQGVAFSGDEIPTGVYFPAISIYMKGNIRVNFGPSFICKYELMGANAVSELQPMSPEDRMIHEKNIHSIRQAREEIKRATTTSAVEVHFA